MPLPSENRLRQLYVNLYTEARARKQGLEELLNKEMVLPPRTAFELYHLQMRMICELVAIGCLAAHDDIPEVHSKDWRSAYKADFILNKLEKLHPNFFPIPVKRIWKGDQFLLVSDPRPTIGKAELIRIYHDCGKVLHRGNIAEIGPTRTTDKDFESIRDWPQKIGVLIDSHIIRLKEPSSYRWGHVDDDKTGYVLEALRENPIAKK